MLDNVIIINIIKIQNIIIIPQKRSHKIQSCSLGKKTKKMLPNTDYNRCVETLRLLQHFWSLPLKLCAFFPFLTNKSGKKAQKLQFGFVASSKIPLNEPYQLWGQQQKSPFVPWYGHRKWCVTTFLQSPTPSHFFFLCVNPWVWRVSEQQAKTTTLNEAQRESEGPLTAL